MILLPNRTGRETRPSGEGFVCTDEYDDFVIEAYGSTEAEAIEKATCYDLLKEAFEYQD